MAVWTTMIFPIDVLVEPEKAFQQVAGRKERLAPSVMACLYLVVSVGVTAAILRHEALLAETLESMVTRPMAGLSAERLGAAWERTQAVLQMPGIAILLGIRHAASQLLSLGAFWIALGVLGSVWRKSWRVGIPMIQTAMAATPVLTLGLLVNTLLRMAFMSLNTTASLLPIVAPCGSASLVCSLARTIDLFSLWYLALVVLGSRQILNGPLYQAALVTTTAWGLVFVCSFLANTGVAWSL